MNLKQLRKNKKLTLDELASETGISNPMLSNYELGKVNPPIRVLFQLSDYFGCSIDYLLAHETKNILHMDSLTAKEKVAINLMKQLDDDQLTLLLGYLAKMTDTPLEEVQNKLEVE